MEFIEGQRPKGIRWPELFRWGPASIQIILLKFCVLWPLPEFTMPSIFIIEVGGRRDADLDYDSIRILIP